MDGPRDLAAALDAVVALHGPRTALHHESGSTTYAGLQDAVRRATSTLIDAWRVDRGDRVAYLGLNRVEALALLFACARIGAVFVPLNTRLAVGELAAIAAHAGPRTLVTDAAHRATGAAVIDGLPEAAASVDLRSIDALSGAPGEARADPPVNAIDDEAPVLLVYTSGTSGAPKGALHSHRGLLANVAAAVAAHEMTADDRVLSALPLFHVGGLCIQTLPALLTGASVVLHARFDAAHWLTAIATMRPTLSLMVPATLRAVLAQAEWSTTPLSCLRLLMTGSSIVPRSLIDAVHARGVPVGQVYGSTETGPVTVVLRRADAMRKAGAAGWPAFEGSVRLVDADGREVAAGTVGEIVVRAPNLMRGYWRVPVSSTFADGWFATGDLGRFDDEGCLEVVGRSRDLIVSGGENVYPAEVEEALLAVDGVVDAAVIGRPDERWGEVPVAFVVGDGSLDEAALGARIAARLAGRLARFKQPQRIVAIDRLPRNAMGKVQAHLLRERLLVDQRVASSA